MVLPYTAINGPWPHLFLPPVDMSGSLLKISGGEVLASVAGSLQRNATLVEAWGNNREICGNVANNWLTTMKQATTMMIHDIPYIFLGSP